VRDREGHAASRVVGWAKAGEGVDVGAVADDCGGGEVHAGADVHLRGGGDAGQWGEVGALPRQCPFLLGGAPVVALMKGPRRLCQRGPGMGVAMTMMVGSRRRQRVL
jgi:hypothetical protein